MNSSMSGTRSLSCVDPRRRDALRAGTRPRGCGRSGPCRRSSRGTARGSTAGEHSTTRPSATRMRSARTCAPKHAVDVVVLAVHVRRDHAAERDELRARRDRREEAARQEQRDAGRAQREAGLGAQHARRRIEREDAVGQRVSPRPRRPRAPAATSRRTSGPSPRDNGIAARQPRRSSERRSRARTGTRPQPLRNPSEERPMRFPIICDARGNVRVRRGARRPAGAVRSSDGAGRRRPGCPARAGVGPTP